MPAPPVAKEEVLGKIFGAFRTYGYDGAALARITEATNLDRRPLPLLPRRQGRDGARGARRRVHGSARMW